MWLVAPELATVKQRPDYRKIDTANMRLIINLRCLDRTMHLEEDTTGRMSGLFAQQSGGGAKGGGEALTTTCLREG